MIPQRLLHFTWSILEYFISFIIIDDTIEVSSDIAAQVFSKHRA